MELDEESVIAEQIFEIEFESVLRLYTLIFYQGGLRRSEGMKITHTPTGSIRKDLWKYRYGLYKNGCYR